ncbi:Unknown protein [Striga hermonthica]|uniref:WPP domain-associated protein n=1 Tax=Striga hermonthica TaxID=68872 RepID=A0A9N7NF79_STRHE|nr:Unknown protein [Striga hermonthica]
MEDIFGQIECRTKSDSVVMRILRSAMDEAHEKLQSRDGPIQFLHDRSTFYELAAILVEGGLSIVRDEQTDDMAANCNKIHSDLTEIKSWLAGRIQDMRHLILEKDRELTDLSETRSRLEKSLELKEREACRAENEDIFRLKDSVDQQVSSMKQKLDEERRALSIERRNKKTRVSSPNLSFEFLDKERNGSPIFKDDVDFDIPGVNVKQPNNQNVLIRKMCSDIDILKETLDLAFGRIGTIPSENQWACSVERDVELTLVRGFLDELRLGGPNERAGFSSDDWMDFLDELRNLCRELRDYVKTNDMHEKRRPVIARSSSEPVSDIEFTGDNNSDFDEVDGKKHVAKMKKNFESIIKKQVEELSRLKREGGEGSFYRIGREKGGSRLERKIRDAITRLENLTKRDQLKKSRSFNFKSDHVRANRSTGNEVKRLKFEVESLKEERDGLFFENFLMQDTYRVLLRCVTSDFREIFEACNSEKVDFATECLLREDIHRFLILEAAKDSSVPENQENVSNADIFREGSLIRKFDSLLKCLEAEEDLMLRANSEIKEHNVTNSLVILNCEEIDERDAIEWLITDDECTFISVSEKLERALQQLYTSKELLVELEQSLKVSEDSEDYCCRGRSSDVDGPEFEKGSSVISYNGVLGNIVELLGVVGNFEHALEENVESKCLRYLS